MGGRIDLMFDALASSLPYVKSGKFKLQDEAKGARRGLWVDPETPLLRYQLEVATTARSAVARTESLHDDCAAGALVRGAFRLIGCGDAGDPYAGHGEQVIDVPMRALGPRQVPADAGIQPTPRATGIDVAPRRKLELTQPADLNANRSADPDGELVGARLRGVNFHGRARRRRRRD